MGFHIHACWRYSASELGLIKWFYFLLFIFSHFIEKRCFVNLLLHLDQLELSSSPFVHLLFVSLSLLFLLPPVFPNRVRIVVLFVSIRTNSAIRGLPKATHNLKSKHFSNKEGFSNHFIGNFYCLKIVILMHWVLKPTQRQGNNSNSICLTLSEVLFLLFSFLFPSPLFFLFALFTIWRSALTSLSRTQMGIRKSGLVSNNYGNCFNILKQKDWAIYLFEMLTVSLNFHSSVWACVFLGDK